MIRPKTTIVAAAVAAALVLPASALAAKPATLIAKTFKHKGYAWSLIVTDNGAKDALTLLAAKHAGRSTQMHTYSFSRGVALKVAGNLGSATLNAKLGRYGSIRMAFRATGKLRSAAPPKGCTGEKAKSRPGKLAGKRGFAVTADSTFFRKIVTSVLAATLVRSGRLECGGGGGGGTPAGGLTLSGSNAAGDAVSLIASKSPSGAVTQIVSVVEAPTATAPASVSHAITAEGPSSSFTAAEDLSSAHVDGVGAFLAGALDFTADGAFGSSAFGTLSGGYTARFDSIGAQTPAAGGLTGALTRS